MSIRRSRYFSLVLLFALGCLVRARAAEIDPAALPGAESPSGTIWLDTLDLSKVSQGWGEPRAGHAVEKNGPLKIHGRTFRHGLGTHAVSQLYIKLNGAAEQFASMVGVDDEVGKRGSVNFQVLVDGKPAAESGVLRGGDPPRLIKADLHGAKTMELFVDSGDEDISYDHADWAGAVIVLAAGAAERPQSFTPPQPAPPAIAQPESLLPAIHGAKIVGTTPGRPFSFLIPATGEKPLHFSAKNLSLLGIELDPDTGIIHGSLPIRSVGGIKMLDSTTVAEIEVRNARGRATRELTIVGGEHKLALTPPMGWNSWNCWANSVSDAKVRAAADAMVASGLASHGFQYVNIDDCWEAGRDANGEIQSNAKFPDMKALADYVHSKGLKLGIYSSPGPKTCAGFTASYQHEAQDARTYAKWGIDYLKYDWCSYDRIAKDHRRKELMKPYLVMRRGLDGCGRDIVYSLCQYGMGDVWEWGAEVGGNCRRTTGDISDNWRSLSGIGFNQNGREKYAGPGHWNDPDMLIVGRVGWGPSLHPTRLTPDEQITHISLWSLLSAPLLIGCDMSNMDRFTLALLTNDEVLDIDQDSLGKPAGRIAKHGDGQVWARPLADGTMAVGLFNLGRQEAKVKVKWSDLNLSGSQPVRDLWRHKDLGERTDGFEAVVPSHGVVLVKAGKRS